MSWRTVAGWFSRSPFRNSASSRSLSVGEDPEEASKRAEAAAIFRRFDHNGDGQLCHEEIHHAMLALGVPVSQGTMGQFFEKVDHDDDGLITKEEFEVFYLESTKALQAVYDELVMEQEEEHRRTSGETPATFLLSHVPAVGAGAPNQHNHRPHITAGTIRTGLVKLGLKASDDEIRAMIHSMDENQDGVVSFEEFRSFLLFLPEANPAAVFDTWRSMAATDDAMSEYTVPKDLKVANEGNLSVAKRLLSGAIAGAVSRTFTAPLDRLKTIMQMGPALGAGARAGGGGGGSGVLHGLRSIYTQGGLRAFFRGNGTNVIKIAPETGIKFYTYDAFKAAVVADPSMPTVSERFAAGGMAGAFSQLAIYPLEIAKTRLALSSPGVYAGPFDCMLKVARHEGVQSLYKGLGTSVVGIVPYAGVDLAMNSMLKEVATKYYLERKSEPGERPARAQPAH